MIATICYSFFRTAHLFSKEINEENLYKAIFLCETQSSKILSFLKPELNEKIELSASEKLQYLQIQASDIFPFTALLSQKINKKDLALSYLQQPLVFIRVRPGHIDAVKKRLDDNNILFNEPELNCLSVATGAKISELPGLNEKFIIQDISSQQVLNYLKEIHLSPGITAWDCCAASGGKSILLNDVLGFAPKLTVTDIRENILKNCKQRLLEAKVPVHNSYETDLIKEPVKAGKEDFDIIICDAPCTGSGTWARTPEQLFFFEEQMVEAYTEKQKKIAVNSFSRLKKAGIFFYITCSVFTQENEAVVQNIVSTTGARILSQKYYEGTTKKADSLFVAVLTKE